MLRFLPTRFWSISAWRNWLRYVHWRLETYGVYYPAGKWNGQAFRLLWRQVPGYLHWVREIDRTRKKSPSRHL